MKRILNLLTVLIMTVSLAGVLPAVDVAAAGGVQTKVNSLVSTYNGYKSSFNHGGASGCLGFAKIASEYVFGVTYYRNNQNNAFTKIITSSSFSTLCSNAKVGDIINRSDNGHTAMITSVSSTSMTLIEYRSSQGGSTVDYFTSSTWSSWKHTSYSWQIWRANNYNTVDGTHNCNSNNSKITKNATCTATGTRTYTCSVCGKVTRTETISALGHNYVKENVPSTETQPGYDRNRCIRCGYTYRLDNYYYYKNFRYIILSDGTIEIINCDISEEVLEIPSSIYSKKVTSIGTLACSGKKDTLKSLIIPEGITSLKTGAFAFCTNLTDVSLPSSLKSIGNEVFVACGSLKNLLIPNGVTSIGDYAFSCSHIPDNMKIPDSVSSIGINIFWSTHYLNDSRKKNSLVINNGYLVDGQTCIGDVIIPNDVKLIADQAFYTENVKSVTIPKSVKYIGDKAIGYASSGKVVGFKIYCIKGTEGERYAIDNGLNYEYHNHSYKGKITAQPSCTNSGIETFTCESCGDSYTEIVSVKGHDYKVTVVEPTCKKSGYSTYTCVNCGDEYKDDYIDATGHNFINGVCTACGEKDPNYKQSTNQPSQNSSNRPNNNSNKPNQTTTPTATPINNTKTTTPSTNKMSVTKPAKVKSVKLTAKKKKLNVSWKKVSGAKGYEVMYAKNNKFKGKKTVTVKKNKVTLKRLKSKKKYFVKVRAYKTVNGNTSYGKWSKVAKKKVK